jgi:hypothetical protein
MDKGFGYENHKERDHLESIYMNGRIILTWILNK